MQRTCPQCSVSFSFLEDDRVMLQKLRPIIAGMPIDLPPPTLCPNCRLIRRMVQGNQYHLYRRTCSFSGKPIISNFHPDATPPVYAMEIWWSDKWDALSFGRPFDFDRPFFDQYKELLDVVPRFALHTTYEYDENSSYVNYCTKNKDCYMLFDSDENRSCLYGYSINKSEDCTDCFRAGSSRLLYGCIDVVQCYSSIFLQDCTNCSDSVVLKNCIGCRNCVACSNLRSKENCMWNEQKTKEEVEAFRKNLRDRSALVDLQTTFERWRLQFPQQSLHGVQNENVSGDYITSSKNAHHCFDCRDLWDCRYNFQGWNPTKDAMDVQEVGDIEGAYETAFSGSDAQRLYFCSHCFVNSDLLYCSYCSHCRNCFGCVGLKRKEYCILNQQYTKEEYEELVLRLIAHMQSTDEWGEYFPVQISSFCYNETLAQDYYPMTKEDAQKRQYPWREDDQRTTLPATATLPDSIDRTEDGIVQEIFTCGGCRKNYRIISQELAALRTLSVPPPTECFLCRHFARQAKRNPRQLYDRPCMKCGKEIETTYSLDRPEIVYCEECYLREIY